LADVAPSADYLSTIAHLADLINMTGDRGCEDVVRRDLKFTSVAQSAYFSLTPDAVWDLLSNADSWPRFCPETSSLRRLAPNEYEITTAFGRTAILTKFDKASYILDFDLMFPIRTIFTYACAINAHQGGSKLVVTTASLIAETPAEFNSRQLILEQRLRLIEEFLRPPGAERESNTVYTT
jgi:hypothetical protein